MTDNETKVKSERRKRMADTLYRRMVAAGMSQTTLSEVSRVARDYIGRYLNGETEPRPDNLKKLAKGLGCSVAEIVYEAEGVSPFTDTESLILRSKEIRLLTGKHQRGTQKDVLDKMGIRYMENGIGELAVSRKHVERVLSGDTQEGDSALSIGEPNFSALGG